MLTVGLFAGLALNEPPAYESFEQYVHVIRAIIMLQDVGNAHYFASVHETLVCDHLNNGY